MPQRPGKKVRGRKNKSRGPQSGRARRMIAVGPTVNPLTINLAAPLATNCVLIGHCDKADVVWTGTEFQVLCEHMLNGNSQTDFMMIYRDRENVPKFIKAKTAKANRYISWSWDTILGIAKSK